MTRMVVRPGGSDSPHRLAVMRWLLACSTYTFVLSVFLGAQPRLFAGAPEPAKKQEPFHYDPKDHRDPFVPLVRDGHFIGLTSLTAGMAAKPVLYGVVWDPGGQSLALINDGEMKVGDMVGGYEVMEIRKDSVMLSDGGEPMTLKISYDTQAPPTVKAHALRTPKGGEEP